MTQRTPNLASALLAAQRALPSVGKDAKNSFHHYAYTSAEGMIGACREALHGAGLALRRAGWKFDGTPEGGLVHSQFILTHGETGEAATDEVTWIVVPEKGRPLDKALAGALTSSLGYYLRDLLLVPREDESEMDRRDDRTYEPRKVSARSESTTLPNKSTPNAPAPRQTRQDAPRAVPATQAATTPAKAEKPAPAAPSAFSEVLASRPAKDCAWKGGLVVRKVGQGKSTSNGSMRYPILFDTGAGEEWASCFDERLMQTAQDCLGGEPVEAFIQVGKFGWTLYGLRLVQSGEQAAAPVAVAEDEIPF